MRLAAAASTATAANDMLNRAVMPSEIGRIRAGGKLTHILMALARRGAKPGIAYGSLGEKTYLARAPAGKGDALVELWTLSRKTRFCPTKYVEFRVRLHTWNLEAMACGVRA
jgi:hypothetical protein